MPRRPLRALRASLAVTLLAGGAVAVAAEAAPTRDATIRVTEGGIPHITAKDFSSLGYGYGYVAAKDNLCILADTYVTVDAQRSRFFGPDAGYRFEGNGTTVNNLNSDFFFQQVIDEGRVEALVAQPAPQGPRTEVREAVRGYVAGYNRLLAEIGGPDGVTDPACAGQPWVRPITETQAYRRFYQLALLASSGVALDGIGGAQPPGPSLPVPSLDPEAAARLLDEKWETLAIGSNAVAVGSAGTANGRGLLLGTPHFPWVGSERFYQTHLTVPGQLDVTGGSLLGVPIVLIGHNATMAWSHTVSTAFRFTPYQLTLVPGSPTTYLYDGKPEAMTSRELTVDVLQDDGTVAPQTRTLWSTRYGPVLTSILGLPIFPWTPVTAFAMADANAANFRYVNHFFEAGQARSVRELLTVLERNQGVPWVNTIAADSAGEALYADISVTPHVTDAKAQRCNSVLGVATFALLRLPVLDGSRSECRWGTDPDALQPGTFGPSSMPHLIRRDYVANMNDSHWLSQPRQPLTGFPTIIGDEEAARTLRTRSGLVAVEERLAGTDGTTRRGFTRQDMQDLVFANRQHAGELTRDDLVRLCRSLPGGYAPSSRGPVDVAPACDTLAAWDVRDDIDSRGALLFRRFWSNVSGQPGLWRTPFDPQDPIGTPRDLETRNPLVALALGDAVQDLRGADIALDAPLGDNQYAVRGDARIPLHGGPGSVGVFNAVNGTWNPDRGGYVDPQHGTSYVQVVGFDGTACPDARTLLTYSQSADPTSPHYADQTRLYAEKTWLPSRLCEKDVRPAVQRSYRLRG